MNAIRRVRALALACAGLLALSAHAQTGGFTSEAALRALFETEGDSPFPPSSTAPYAGTLSFSALGSRFASANGHGYRNELKIAAAQRRPIGRTREHFSAVVTPMLPDGARTIVAQYHVEGLDTILKVYVQDTLDARLLDGRSRNGIFDVVVKMPGGDGREATTALGTVRAGDSFGLDIRFEGGDATVAVTSGSGGAVRTARSHIADDARTVYFKFGDYLQALDPESGTHTTSPARWDAYFRRNGIDSSRVQFSHTEFVRDQEG